METATHEKGFGGADWNLKELEGRKWNLGKDLGAEKRRCKAVRESEDGK